MLLINEKEIAFDYYVDGLISESYYIGFFDLEKDKKIQSFSVDNRSRIMALLNEDIFIYSNGNKLYPVYLKTHSKKKEYKIGKYDWWSLDGIVPLNDKKFLVSYRSDVYQFELDNNNKLNMISQISLKNERLLKYPKNRLIISIGEDYQTHSGKIHLYC